MFCNLVKNILIPFIIFIYLIVASKPLLCTEIHIAESGGVLQVVKSRDLKDIHMPVMAIMLSIFFVTACENL